METTKVRMKSNETHKDGSALKAGAVYELPHDSASHWLKRGKAETVAEEAVDAPAKERVDPLSLTVADLREALEEAGVEIPVGALKADLVKLHKKHLG